VGLSIALAESALTVLDALRMACVFGGIPALFYTDGGSGYVNNLMRDDRTGLFQRLGIEPCNAIPGRPQGKGLMERAVKTLWVSAAQGLESYTGANMDQDAAHRNFKLSRKAIKDAATGKKPKRAVLPTWEDFKAHLLRRVESYNATPHRELPVYRDAQGRRKHYSPDEYWQTFVARGFEPVEVAPDIATELFMPGEKRQTRNGWISFYGGRYFADELAARHGDAS
jgi:putative transposase